MTPKQELAAAIEAAKELGRAGEELRNIRANTECLPKLCETVARHDERIGALEGLRMTLSRVAVYLLCLGIVAGIGFGLWVYRTLK